MLSKKINLLVLLLLATSACAAPVSNVPSGGEEVVTQAEEPSAEVIADATATTTPTPDELLAMGQEAANRGDYPTAITYYDQAIAANSGNAQAYLLRGNAYKELDDISQAISNYDQAIAIDPNLATAFNNRGLAYADMGDSARALLDFAEAIRLAPTFGLAFRNRAEIQAAAGNSAAAALDLQIYLTLVPGAPDKAQVEAQIAELQAQTLEDAEEDGLLFADDFSDTSSGWYSNGHPNAVAQYAGDGYVLRLTTPNDSVWAMPGRLFTDVRVEVQARKQTGANDNNIFGVMCRVQGTGGNGQFYAFLISSDGYYGIGKTETDSEGNNTFVLINAEKMFYSSVISQGENNNKIAAICDGDRLALFVNDQLLAEATDDDFGSGQVGMFIGTFTGDSGASIFFDDFAVYNQED
jgi:tetratricopeptide (TPR) repeat protein